MFIVNLAKNILKKGDQEAMVEYIEALESANEELMAKLADSDTEYVEESDYLMIQWKIY